MIYSGRDVFSEGTRRRWGRMALLLGIIATYSFGGLWMMSILSQNDLRPELEWSRFLRPAQYSQVMLKQSSEGELAPALPSDRNPSPASSSYVISEENDAEWDQDETIRPPGAASLPQPPLLTHVDDRERPEAFLRCGDWQEGYMELHRQILAGERPPRYLVAVLSQSGLADQLVGVMSLFFWAYLTGRAFQITVGEQPIPPLEAAFDAPFINWTRPAGDPPVLTEHLYRPYNGNRHYPPSHPSVQNMSEYGSMYLINNKNRFFSTLDLNTLPKSGADKPVLFMASNRGRVFRLFDNPYHRRQLYDVGLRPETAFACGFRFLFAPNEVTRDETGWQLAEEHLIPLHYPDDEETEKEAMLEARNTLRIGIQIRVGDFVFNQPGKAERLSLDDYMSYFQCAREIEHHKRTPETTKVVWYLVSDSLRLKELALEKFGQELVVTSTEPSRHVLCAKDGLTDCNESGEMAESLAAAAADMMGLAETDYIILTRQSGFGKVAAWLNMRWHNVWWLSPGEPQMHPCGARSYVQLEDMADKWSGL
jgi:hypothetical protein